MTAAERRHKIWLVAVLAACAICVLVRLFHAQAKGDELRYDAPIYHRLAVQLMDTGTLGYSENHMRSWRPPLYPAFLACIYTITGVYPLAAKALEAIIAGIVAFLMAVLGRRLGRPLAGLCAVYLFALSGFEIRHAVALYPENLASLGVVSFVLLGTGPRRLWRFVAQGAVAAFILHLQPGLVTLPILEVVWMTWRHRREKGWRDAVVLLGTLVLLVTPWTIRNHAVHGEFVFMSTNGGFNLVKGNNDAATGDPITRAGRIELEEITADVRASLDDPTDEVAYDRALRARALAWMRANPGRTARLAITRARHFFLPDYFFLPHSKWPLTFGLIGPLAILGFVIAWRGRVELGGLSRAILAVSGPAILVVWAGPRYRMPAMPEICLLAGLAVGTLMVFVRLRFVSPPTEQSPPGETGTGDQDKPEG